MGVIDKVEDQQGTRTLGLGSFKLIIEDWMLDKNQYLNDQSTSKDKD